MSNKFKAGDFTSGKMADIFKACYIRDIAVISHKQFGESYMIPSEFFRVLAKKHLLKNPRFKEFSDMNFGSAQAFLQAEDSHCFEEIEEYFGGEIDIDNWFDVLNHILSGK